MRGGLPKHLTTKEHAIVTGRKKTKNARSNQNSNLISTFLSPLDLQKIQMIPHLQGIVGYAQERVTASVACEGEVGKVPDGGCRKFEQDNEGGTTSVACKGDPTKSGYL